MKIVPVLLLLVFITTVTYALPFPSDSSNEPDSSSSSSSSSEESKEKSHVGTDDQHLSSSTSSPSSTDRHSIFNLDPTKDETSTDTTGKEKPKESGNDSLKENTRPRRESTNHPIVTSSNQEIPIQDSSLSSSTTEKPYVGRVPQLSSKNDDNTERENQEDRKSTLVSSTVEPGDVYGNIKESVENNRSARDTQKTAVPSVLNSQSEETKSIPTPISTINNKYSNPQLSTRNEDTRNKEPLINNNRQTRQTYNNQDSVPTSNSNEENPIQTSSSSTTQKSVQNDGHLFQRASRAAQLNFDSNGPNTEESTRNVQLKSANPQVGSSTVEPDQEYTPNKEVSEQNKRSKRDTDRPEIPSVLAVNSNEAKFTQIPTSSSFTTEKNAQNNWQSNGQITSTDDVNTSNRKPLIDNSRQTRDTEKNQQSLPSVVSSSYIEATSIQSANSSTTNKPEEHGYQRTKRDTSELSSGDGSRKLDEVPSTEQHQDTLQENSSTSEPDDVKILKLNDNPLNSRTQQ